MAVKQKNNGGNTMKPKTTGRILSVLLTMVLIAGLMMAFPLTASATAETAPGIPTMNTRVFANGTPVVIRDDNGTPKMYLATDTAFSEPLFGGASMANIVIYGGWEAADYIGNTSLVIQSGTFNSSIYGGNREGSLTGSTNVTINGGTFNHELYGGSAFGAINGSTNITINGGDVIGRVVVAGGYAGPVTGNTNIRVNGGNLGGLYGGSFGRTEWDSSINGTLATVGGVNIDIRGGIVSFIQAGCAEALVLGNIAIDIRGGSVTEYIFTAGTFIEAKVMGNVTVNVSPSVDLSAMTVQPPIRPGFHPSFTEAEMISGTQTINENYDFGDVPPTGIPGIQGAMAAMIAFLLLSAGLWGYILRRKGGNTI